LKTVIHKEESNTEIKFHMMTHICLGHLYSAMWTTTQIHHIQHL